MVINNIEDLAKYLGTEVDSLEHDIYKYTECGAWIKWNQSSVTVGSIVEGSDAEFTADPLTFPFSSVSFDEALEWVNKNACEAWYEANDPPTMLGTFLLELCPDLADMYGMEVHGGKIMVNYRSTAERIAQVLFDMGVYDTMPTVEYDEQIGKWFVEEL